MIEVTEDCDTSHDCLGAWLPGAGSIPVIPRPCRHPPLRRHSPLLSKAKGAIFRLLVPIVTVLSNVSELPERPMSIFTILFVILLIAWILGWTVFHVASGLIHILLIVALISLVLHFVRGTRRVA